jgi:hypothetical protein
MLAAATTCGAKNKNQPIFIDPAFRFAQIDVLYILPAIDLAVQKDKNSEMYLELLDANAPYDLKRRGYRTVPENKLSMLNAGGLPRRPDPPPTRLDATEAELKDPQESFIRTLGPDNARWVLLLALTDASASFRGVNVGKAHVMGMLFDKQRGKLVWQAVGSDWSPSGVIFGKSYAKQGAIVDSARVLFFMFDKQKRK